MANDAGANSGKDRKVYRDTNLQIIFGITLMAVLGVSSITPAFPTIARELNTSAQRVGLLITVFTLPGVVLTPILGVLADRYGRKKIIIPALMLFGIAGGACFFARDFNALLILRFFQGMGGGSLGSINTTLIGDIYEGRQRAQAMGYNASVLSVGTASYPLIGGALTLVAWHYPFLLSLIALPIGLWVILKLKNPEPKKPEDMRRYFRGILKSINVQVVGLFFASILTFVILYGVYLTYFPFLIKESFNGSPVVIGLLMSAMSLTTAVTSAQLGRLSDTFSHKKLLVWGFILYSIALLSIPMIGHLWVLLIPAFVFGLGHGVNIPSILTLMSGFAPLEHRAAFMSMNSMVLRGGQTIGPPLMGLFYTLGGVDATFFAGAALALIVMVILVFTLK
ncbi:MAG: MFS transporter [Candidatus Zixiibacteriota bacterium]